MCVCERERQRERERERERESGITTQSRYSSTDKAASFIHSFALMLYTRSTPQLCLQPADRSRMRSFNKHSHRQKAGLQARLTGPEKNRPSQDGHEWPLCKLLYSTVPYCVQWCINSRVGHACRSNVFVISAAWCCSWQDAIIRMIIWLGLCLLHPLMLPGIKPSGTSPVMSALEYNPQWEEQTGRHGGNCMSTAHSL